MKSWESVAGKWNDEENYILGEPAWKRVLAFVRDQYNDANIILEYKDGLEKKSITFLEFTQKVCSVLINEIHRIDDNVLCLDALHHVAEKTGITLEKIKHYCPFCNLDILYEFVCADFTSMNVYLEHILNSNCSCGVKEFVLVETFCSLRLERCPCEDWEKNLQYYFLIEKVLNVFDDSYEFLVARIKEWILINKAISRNGNKKVEELFAGWED